MRNTTGFWKEESHEECSQANGLLSYISLRIPWAYPIFSRLILGSTLPTQLPDRIKEIFLYNLACFYAQQKLLEQDTTYLQEVLALAPDLKEHSESDPDLDALRARLA